MDTRTEWVESWVMGRSKMRRRKKKEQNSIKSGRWSQKLVEKSNKIGEGVTTCWPKWKPTSSKYLQHIIGREFVEVYGAFALRVFALCPHCGLHIPHVAHTRTTRAHRIGLRELAPTHQTVAAPLLLQPTCDAKQSTRKYQWYNYIKGRHCITPFKKSDCYQK